jgi:hypothetical protein
VYTPYNSLINSAQYFCTFPQSTILKHEIKIYNIYFQHRTFSRRFNRENIHVDTLAILQNGSDGLCTDKIAHIIHNIKVFTAMG